MRENSIRSSYLGADSIVVSHRLAPVRLSGRPGCVRSSAWICVFSSQHSTSACSGGVEVETNDVFELLDEMRVVGELEGFDSVRLEVMSAPNAGHRSGVGAKVRGQGARAPVSRSFGSFLERDAHHLFHVGCLARRARAPRARGILQQSARASARQRGGRCRACRRCPCATCRRPPAVRCARASERALRHACVWDELAGTDHRQHSTGLALQLAWRRPTSRKFRGQAFIYGPLFMTHYSSRGAALHVPRRRRTARLPDSRRNPPLAHCRPAARARARVRAA